MKRSLILLLISVVFTAFYFQSPAPVSTISKSKIDSIQNVKNRIDSFLVNPFNIHKFKKKTGGSNSGGLGSKSQYYFHPKSEGMYYYFFWPNREYFMFVKDTALVFSSGWGMQINTFQPKGKYYLQFYNPRETLVEYCASFNDKDIPELAFVGQSKKDIINKLGSPKRNLDSILVYSHLNNVLLLSSSKGENGRVSGVKYLKLNFNVDTARVIPAEILKKIGCKGG